MAREGETIAEWSRRVIFSYDLEVVKGEYKIPNTNNYELVGFSALEIIRIIKTLIEKYELSYDDFIYSARFTKNRLNWYVI